MYIESANIGEDYQSTVFFDLFGINFLNGGEYFEVTNLKGAEHELTADRLFSYQGGDAPHYNVDQLEETDASLLLKSSDGIGRMFINETDDFKVISSSVVMGAMANGSQLNLKPYLLGEIVNYFFGYNPVTGLIENLQGMSTLLNYPNPFKSETTIEYSISETGTVQFDIYSLQGDHIKSWEEWNEAGRHQTTWNAIGKSGTSVPSGNYILQQTSSGKKVSRQIIVLR